MVLLLHCKVHRLTLNHAHMDVLLHCNCAILGDYALVAFRRTQLGFFGHLGLVDNIPKYLLFLKQLVLVQGLLLVEVVVVLLLVLFQLIQSPLQRPTSRTKIKGGKCSKLNKKCVPTCQTST